MKRRTFIKSTAMSSTGLIAFPTLLKSKDWSGDKKIKIGQIGVSHEHASQRMNTLRKMSDIFEVVGIVDDRNSTAARFIGSNMKAYEGLKWMKEDELLSTPGIEAIVVETANTDLVPTAMRCMKYNLAISMDKPGGENLSLFAELLDGCKERNLPFHMGYMFRNNQAMQFCLKAVRENLIGDIFEIQANMSHNFFGKEDTYQRYLSNFKGGIMFNLGCHHIDFVVSMLGRPQRVTSFLGSTKNAFENVKNNCVAILEYPHTIVRIHASDSEIDGAKYRKIKICGSNGTIELSPIERFDGVSLTLDLHLFKGDEKFSKGSHVVDFGVQKDRYKDQFIELAQIIKGKIKNPYTYEHDYLTQEVHLAASGYRSWNF